MLVLPPLRPCGPEALKGPKGLWALQARSPAKRRSMTIITVEASFWGPGNSNLELSYSGNSTPPPPRPTPLGQLSASKDLNQGMKPETVSNPDKNSPTGGVSWEVFGGWQLLFTSSLFLGRVLVLGSEVSTTLL